ncbi:MAG: hypothetical protein M3257_07935 [Actinomycetota bacterium]|nr:hypothetical protein [Actinomycetota bacterium]
MALQGDTVVTSCLAKIPDPTERRRYLPSYRRSVSPLVWIGWPVQWSALRRRELL